MVDFGGLEDKETIDWEHLLDNIPDDINFDVLDDLPANGFSTSPDSGCSLSIDDIEQYLMLDDESNHQVQDVIVADGFFSDVLLDSSSPGSGSDQGVQVDDAGLESAEAETDEGEKGEDKHHESGEDVLQTEENNDVGADDADPVAKKRKRQMRNRDAAVRSRERKKSYVKDLEMKSRYYEAECKRLGILLQCTLAENQSLRLSMHTHTHTLNNNNSKAFDASTTKQESAVLLLESLLLGSLLGFLGIIMYLLILPSQLLSVLGKGLLENVDNVESGSLGPKMTGSRVFLKVILFDSFMMGKRCKASRSRMKFKIFDHISHGLVRLNVSC